jgi:predicted nucleic acid-binding protein
MILVDSSVWIGLFCGDDTPQTRLMVSILQNDDEELAIADIILLEVLQGFRSGKQARTALRSVEGLPCFTLGGKPLAVLAASNYRRLRQKGVAVRSTIDCLIATFCVENNFPLLHDDRDYDPFEQHLGLRAVAA